MKKIFPLGSECFVNAGLDGSKLASRKVYKSPFNGTRLLGNRNLPPVMMFFNMYEDFKYFYCDKNAWKLKIDKKDLQAHNYILNLRRCHLNPKDPFSFIEKCNGAFCEIENNIQDIIFLLDLNDYCIYEKDVLLKVRETLEGKDVKTFVRRNQLKTSFASINKVWGLEPTNTSKNIGDVLSIFHPIELNVKNSNGILEYNKFFNNTEEI